MNKKNTPPWLLVLCYSCLGVCLPAAVTQYSMVTSKLASAFGCGTKIILMADSTRAVCLVAAMFLSGYAARYLGRIKTICLGLAMQIFPQFLIPWAVSVKSLPLLFVFKGMQGFNALAFPVYLSTIMQTVPQGAVGFSTAVFNGSFVAGAGVGAWLSGQIIPRFGWVASFYVIGAICLFFAIPALAVTPKREVSAADDMPRPRAGTGEKNSLYAAIMKKPATWLLVLALSANTWVMQTVTVDMAVYANDMLIPYTHTGNLMFMISVVTVVSSILGGALSDYAAARSPNPLRVRAYILAAGCLVSAAAVLGLVFMPEGDTARLTLCSSLMVFGISWAGGVFWSLPQLVYRKKDATAATAFCSGASNLVNPLAPIVVGVVLGSAGLWPLGWLTCSLVSALSFAAAMIIPRLRIKEEL